jgi:hypothetical protein
VVRLRCLLLTGLGCLVVLLVVAFFLALIVFLRLFVLGFLVLVQVQ